MKIYFAAALFLIAIAFQVKGIFIFRRMMNEVNGLLPPGDQIPEIGPSWLRGRVIKLHRQFFPESTLRKEMYTVWSLQTAIFLSAVACVVRFK
jgi:hypothetical protein